MATFNASIQIRYTDLDPQAHVNNVMVFEYAQQARVQFLRSGAGQLLADGLVVVSHEIEYRQPIRYSQQPLRVEILVSKLGSARFDVDYRFWQDDQVRAVASTIMCPFDFAVQRPRRLSRQEHDFLAAYLGSPAQLRPVERVKLNGRGHRTEVQSRWSDADQFGHVNNVKHLDYVLAGRIEMTAGLHPSMLRAGMPGAPGKDEHQWLVVRQGIDYLGQLSERLAAYHVLTAPTKLGRSSLTLTGEIVDPEGARQVLATSRVVLVNADGAGKPVPMPDQLRAAITQRLVS